MFPLSPHGLVGYGCCTHYEEQRDQCSVRRYQEASDSGLPGFLNYTTNAFFTLGNISAGQEAKCIVRLKIDTPQDINNLAEVRSGSIDPDLGSNYVETMHEVVAPSLVGGFLIPPDGALIPLLLVMGVATVAYEAVRRKKRHT